MVISLSPKTAIAIFFAALLFLVPSCSEKSQSQNQKTHGENNALKNDYFGMTLNAPQEWVLATEDQTNSLFNIGADIATGDDAQMKALVDTGLKRMIALFAIFENELGAPVEVNPSVMAFAENVSFAPGIKTGKDYFFHAKNLMSQSTVQYEIEDGYGERQFGDVTFDRMNLTITVAGKRATQSYYAARHLDYIVVIIASPNDERTETILTNLNFSW